jgi:sec-independent protein translocase protein TatA
MGPKELLILGAILVLLFGAKKIPQLFRGIAEGIREFKKASRDNGHDESR